MQFNINAAYRMQYTHDGQILKVNFVKKLTALNTHRQPVSDRLSQSFAPQLLFGVNK